METDRPPEDPEEWSDEQWLAWLVATDAAPPPAPDDEDAAPTAAMTRVARSAPGRLLGAAMRGAHDALYGPTRDIAIVVEAPADPHEDDPYDVLYDPEHPERAVVVARDRGRPDGPPAGTEVPPEP